MFKRLDEIEIKLILKAWITENDVFDFDHITLEDGSTLTPKISFEHWKDGKTIQISLAEAEKLFYNVESILTDIDVTGKPCEYEEWE